MSRPTKQQVSESPAASRCDEAATGLPARKHANLTEDKVQELIAAAAAARERAYAPYSRFPVGAALQATDGTVYVGCNVENASYGLTSCAERNALFHAVAQGARNFLTLAVVTENGVTPCGACRQVLAEFAPELVVIVADVHGQWRLYDMAELLPDAFGPNHLP